MRRNEKLTGKTRKSFKCGTLPPLPRERSLGKNNSHLPLRSRETGTEFQIKIIQIYSDFIVFAVLIIKTI